MEDNQNTSHGKTEAEQLRTLQFVKDIRKLTEAEIYKKSLQDRIWNQRRLDKIRQNKKVNVLFVCSRPAAWGSLRTVCEAFAADERFNVKILAIPEKEPLPGVHYRHNIYSDIGAYDHLSATAPCRVINGYNRISGKWVDLADLKPDYVFFQTPYNNMRPAQYDANDVSTYARLCYLSYGTFLFAGDFERVVYPMDFFTWVNFHFYESPLHKAQLDAYYRLQPAHKRPRCVLSGYARFDDTEQYREAESPLWPRPKGASQRIIWTPRWTTSQNNAHFFDYKDSFLQLCDQNKNIDLVFRPHPLTFKESVARAQMTAQQVEEYKNCYKARTNAVLDLRPEYLDTFHSSDVLVTDISSIMPEYLASGKPLIYCHKENSFNELGARLAESYYWARNWDEVVTTLNMLRNGEDPLREKRLATLRENYHMPVEGCGNFVKKFIEADFFGGHPASAAAGNAAAGEDAGRKGGGE